MAGWRPKSSQTGNKREFKVVQKIICPSKILNYILVSHFCGFSRSTPKMKKLYSTCCHTICAHICYVLELCHSSRLAWERNLFVGKKNFILWLRPFRSSAAVSFQVIELTLLTQTPLKAHLLCYFITCIYKKNHT